ncbi:MAG: hypothetical protein GDA48_16620 [Hormoscilla sp. GM102CHS1]|nr:hypothetical protein [Hormoscilla sp. GM102CHS1]
MEPLPDSAIVYQALLRKWWIDSETYEFAIPENNISQYILSHKLGMRREPDIQYWIAFISASPSPKQSIANPLPVF